MQRLSVIPHWKSWKSIKANEVGALLKKFDAISVRDAICGTIVEEAIEKETSVQSRSGSDLCDYMNCCDKIPQVQTNEKYLILVEVYRSYFQ